jgi:hypothetical protein
MNVSMLRVEWPIIRIVVGPVPDLLCADLVGVFRISLPPRSSAASALAAINQKGRRFPDLRISYEFAGDLFEPLRQINILL